MASWILKQRPDGKYDLVPKDDLNAWLEKYQPKTKHKFAMPTKVERGSWVMRDGKLVKKSAEILQFKGRGLQVIRDIEPFQNVGIDRNEIVGGRAQKRDMMRARGIEECGDQIRPARNAPHYDAKAHQQSVVQSLKRALHHHGLGD